VKETTAIIFLAIFSSGCVCGEMLSDKEGWSGWDTVKNDFALWKNPGPLKVNGKELSPSEQTAFVMKQQLINGWITTEEYNDWILTQTMELPRPFNDPTFYLDRFGELKRVPKRDTIEWMWYERTVLGTRD
jgi:hypothetical protein